MMMMNDAAGLIVNAMRQGKTPRALVGELIGRDPRMQIAALTTQLSQVNQSTVIGARIDAAVGEVLRRTGNDCPTAAYLVQPPTPVNFPVNGCGTVQFAQQGGCGYGNCGY